MDDSEPAERGINLFEKMYVNGILNAGSVIVGDKKGSGCRGGKLVAPGSI